MPKAYFEPEAESLIVDQILKAKRACKDNLASQFETAIEYLDGIQVEDTRRELMNRFPSSMTGDSGQSIYPVTMPLTERYVAEMATAYNRPVKRTLTLKNGTETDETIEATSRLNDALAECEYDEVMHQVDRNTVLLGTMGTWHGYDDGGLRVEAVYPQDVYPVASEDIAARQQDVSGYKGFVVETSHAQEDVYFAEKRSFAYITREGTVYYDGGDAREPRDTKGLLPNPYSFNQRPVLPFVFWHRQKQIKRLISDAEPDIVFANREANIMFSLLFDTIRFQGYDTPIKKLIEPRDPKAKQKHGARFPVLLELNEDFSFASSNAPYAAIVDVISKYVRLIAVCKRLSPNDFASDGIAPASGFAKLIDSLPKIEARKERIARLKAIEEHSAWPVNCAILVWAGVLPESAKTMKLRVQFSEIEMPKSESERSQANTTDVQLGITSPIQLIMERYGLSEEAATEAYEKNKGFIPQPAQALQEPVASSLGAIIAARRTAR